MASMLDLPEDVLSMIVVSVDSVSATSGHELPRISAAESDASCFWGHASGSQ